MKKIIALVVGMIFVLSTASFALWGIGEKKAETTKTKVMTKVKKEKKEKKEKKDKKEKKEKKAKKAEKKGAKPAVPPKK